MVNYKDLGLVNTREMFARAIKGGYAIPAFNFNNMEQMQAIRALWNMPRNWAANILKLFFTLTTETLSRLAKAVSIQVSPQ